MTMSMRNLCFMWDNKDSDSCEFSHGNHDCRLVCAMLHWRAENSSLLLETEVDALSQDDEGYTPLVSFLAVSQKYLSD